MKLLRAALCLFAPALTSAAAEPGGWAPTLTVATSWNSNLTNADRDSDVIGAIQVHAELATFARRIALGHDDALILSVHGALDACPRFDGLDRMTLGPRLAWQHKFGLGPLAPVLRLELGADGVVARESNRSGVGGSGRVLWRQRFDESTRVTVSYEWARHDARTAVFDRTGGEAALELAREFNDQWQLALTARWRSGDVLSYATPPRADLVALAEVRALVDTFDEPRIAYSVAAHTVGGSVAVTRVIDERTSWTFAYEGRITERSPLRYVNHLVSASLNRQF